MQTEDFVSLNALEESFWWFVGMRAIQEALLDPLLTDPSAPREILDIGCGTGGNMAWLQRYRGDGTIAGLDIESTALQFCLDNKHERLALASATHLPFASGAFDLVTMFDVVQQLPGGAVESLREVHRVLKPGGVAFIRSAAYEWMRSGHDTALGTRHRFTLRELAMLAERAGLHVVRRTYANTALLPVAAVRRLVLKPLHAADQGSDVKTLPKGLTWMNRLFAAMLRVEARLLRRTRFRLPFGLSAIVIVRRPEYS